MGQHTDTSGQSLNATADFIRAVVDSYNPKNHEAPAVIGHPQNNHPAYGWVESLSFDETKGVLYATFKQLEEKFVKLLKAGRFKKRSASFYPPDHPANPTKGKPYLRHVGFLGAQPPAIKGLADFSDDKDCPTYEFSEIHDSHLLKGQNMPEQTTHDNSRELSFAEREAELQAREDAIIERENALKQEKQQGFYTFTESLLRAGKITPAERDPIISVLIDADDANSTFNFTENGVTGERSGADALKSVLERLPSIIEFGELTNTDPNKRNLPQHIGQDSDDLLAERIRRFADEHNLSYAEAVQQFNGDI